MKLAYSLGLRIQRFSYVFRNAGADELKNMASITPPPLLPTLLSSTHIHTDTARPHSNSQGKTHTHESTHTRVPLKKKDRKTEEVNERKKDTGGNSTGKGKATGTTKQPEAVT